MISQKVDFTKQLTFVRYGRMSDRNQNPTSPDQQFDNIDRALKRCGYDHWQELGDYRDDGISGRRVRKRTGFTRMLFDVKSGAVSPDLILVDDLDRLGRSEDLPQIRRDLYNKYGVLILDAKSNFEDPNTPQGRIYNSIEEIRAVEEGRTKAHRVMRGKRDAVSRGHWCGGKPPFGYQLEYHSTQANGLSRPYSKLAPNPATAWIIKSLFAKADETGWGQDRLCHFLNSHPDIPDYLKPFHGSCVGSWLDQEIYTGTMVWPKVATDIISDCRVIEKVSSEDQIRVDDYCEPIIDRSVYERVNQIRKTRGQLRKAALAASSTKCHKQLRARAPGMTLRYLLTGLVRCGHCNRAMVPQSGGRYISKDNEEREYTSYVCPAFITGGCPNGKKIPEKWLRIKVVDAIKSRLFPSE